MMVISFTSMSVGALQLVHSLSHRRDESKHA